LLTHVEAHTSNHSHGKVEERLFKYQEQKTGKNTSEKQDVLMQIKSLQGVETIQISSHSLED
jgi:hypothetical protein